MINNEGGPESHGADGAALLFFFILSRSAALKIHRNCKNVGKLLYICTVETFKDLDDNRQIIYVLGLFIAFMALGTGLVLTDKKKGN